MKEPEFIAALKGLARSDAARGLEDDAAALEFGSETLILTHDTLVQGVHVREDEDPADIAWKLIAVNLSDLAAKGARPLGVLVSHMLGNGTSGSSKAWAKFSRHTTCRCSAAIRWLRRVAGCGGAPRSDRRRTGRSRTAAALARGTMSM